MTDIPPIIVKTQLTGDPPARLVLYEHVDFGRPEMLVNTDLQNLGPYFGQDDGISSSVKVFTNEWLVLWEGLDHDPSNDQLWLAPAGAGCGLEISDLRRIPRPHGNNHWNDRIRCVRFMGTTPPVGDNENRTILFPNGNFTVGNA